MNRNSWKWWFCFGTMLTLVREKGEFKKHDDVDIGVFYDEYEPRLIENFAQSTGWEIKNKIVHDVSGKPLFMSLTPNEDAKRAYGNVHVDIFAWVKFEDHYWHTYDVKMEKPKRGVPHRYIFKGVESWIFDSGFVNRDNVAGGMIHGYIPLKYGTLLDRWYPDWLVKREEVSHADRTIRMKSCKGFKTGGYEDLRNDRGHA